MHNIKMYGRSVVPFLTCVPLIILSIIIAIMAINNNNQSIIISL